MLRKCNRDAIPAFLKVSKNKIDMRKLGLAAMAGALLGIGGASFNIGGVIGSVAASTMGGTVAGTVTGTVAGSSIGGSFASVGVLGIATAPGVIVGGALGVVATIAASIIAQRFRQ